MFYQASLRGCLADYQGAWLLEGTEGRGWGEGVKEKNEEENNGGEQLEKGEGEGDLIGQNEGEMTEQRKERVERQWGDGGCMS